MKHRDLHINEYIIFMQLEETRHIREEKKENKKEKT